MTHRMVLVIPSPNVTVETEVPALLARHADARFSFHPSRMRMHRVSPEELLAMNDQRSGASRPMPASTRCSTRDWWR